MSSLAAWTSWIFMPRAKRHEFLMILMRVKHSETWNTLQNHVKPTKPAMPEIWHVFPHHFAEGLLCTGCFQINDSPSTMSRTLTPKRPQLKGIAAQVPQRSSLNESQSSTKASQNLCTLCFAVDSNQISRAKMCLNMFEHLISLLAISHLAGTWRRNLKE